MKRVFHFLAAAMVTIALCSASDSTPQQKYIERWGPTAVREMYRSGVPASITLAQGILESRSGESELASRGNNHFGIKCHSDWKGKTMKVDDDRKGECFRVYGNADDSFRDHSDFLRYQDRYKFLFDFDTKDYESWAYGLKKAGYATDPAYPSKLLKIIDEYDLSRFDSMTQAQASRVSSKAQKQDGEVSKPVPSAPSQPKPADVRKEDSSKESKAEAKAAAKAEAKAAKVEDKAAVRARKSAERQARKSRLEDIPDEIPQSPHSIEQARRLSRTVSEEFHVSLNREVLTVNGVPFVYSIEGETYASIAAANNLFVKEILAINDLPKEERLLPGTVVYIQPKKTQAEKGLDKYIVETDGEILRDICQRFAVRQKSIEKLNGFTAGHVLREGDTIILRKQ